MNWLGNKAGGSKSPLRLLCTGLWLCCAGSTASAANLVEDFSSSDNPNGEWSYGWTSTLGGSFNAYVNSGNRGGIDFWYDWHGAGLEGPDPDPDRYPSMPFVAYNGSSTRQIFNISDFDAGSVILLPGASAEFSVVRWTAPTTQSVQLETSFADRAYMFWAEVDVHVLLNGMSIHSDHLSKYDNTDSFADTLSLSTGDTLDFAVGNGLSTTGYESVMLAVNISAVPEPAAWATFVVGLGVLAAGSGWRRKSRPLSR